MISALALCLLNKSGAHPKSLNTHCTVILLQRYTNVVTCYSMTYMETVRCVLHAQAINIHVTQSRYTPDKPSLQSCKRLNSENYT